ncbi:hypothetical protein BV25DRAFT_1349577 [Artomyces pyxidatus]|uniref:Uncharacterized protein n=1 Tax=Artomyces pyxidatus TaxID=48021 RepID=A0ACB8SMT7_9AGAM|nr:hypothetical protein BV25DRAFT_1349577 [Artomyces pyxidatus]
MSHRRTDAARTEHKSRRAYRFHSLPSFTPVGVSLASPSNSHPMDGREDGNVACKHVSRANLKAVSSCRYHISFNLSRECSLEDKTTAWSYGRGPDEATSGYENNGEGGGGGEVTRATVGAMKVRLVGERDGVGAGGGVGSAGEGRECMW